MNFISNNLKPITKCHQFLFAFSSKNVMPANKMPIGKIKKATKIFSYEIGLSNEGSSHGLDNFESI